jgi:YD repeat-containing protein
VRNLVEIGNKFIASLLVAIVLLLPATLPASADNAQYFYDPGGRLIGMIDTTAGSATYSYDQAGNIKTIVRTPSSTIGVVQFFPSSGPTGTLVKISGTAFVGGTTTVKFGTVTAAPTSVTANEIVVPVPSTFTGSAAITISTTSPAISTSTTPFTVTSPAGAPTITSFTPTKQVQGSSVTVTGTHFNTLNSKVYVNGQAAQITGTPTSTSITFNVPQASSGKVSVQTLVSTATSGSDLIVPPGSLTAAQVTNTVRTTIGAAPTVIATGGAGTATLIRFDVTNQTGVAAHVNLTSTGNTTVQLLGPSGGVLKSQSVGLSDVWVSASDQIEPGTYTLAVLPSTSGSVTATLYDLPIAPTATVPMDGTTTTLVTSAPGQKALFTFAGTAGQKAMVHFDWSGFPEWLNYYWSQPDGTFLTVTPNAETSSWLSVAPVTLQQTGTYKLLAAPGFAFNATPPIGTISANVFSVPPDITAQAPLDGTHAVLDFGTPGMRGTFTLDSPAPNTKITLFVLNQVAGGSDVTLKDPNGLVVIPTTYYCCTGWLGNAPIILSQQGTYNLEVVPHIISPATHPPIQASGRLR